MPTNLPHRTPKSYARVFIAVFAIVLGLGILLFSTYYGRDGFIQDTTAIDD